MTKLSGEKKWLSREDKYATLDEKHEILKDNPGQKSGPIGVVEKLEGYLRESYSFSKSEVKLRTKWMTGDQREHLFQHVREAWEMRKPLYRDGTRTDFFTREYKDKVVSQSVVRDRRTGRFVREEKK